MTTKALLFLSTLLFITGATQAQSKSVSKKTNNSVSNDVAFLNGTWKSENGNTFAIFYNGHFNVVEKDSVGNWTAVHAGRYVVNNDKTFAATAEYTSFPEHTGSINTVEYKLDGKNLRLRNFKKLVTGHGEDVTAQIPKQEWVTMVRQTK